MTKKRHSSYRNGASALALGLIVSTTGCVPTYHHGMSRAPMFGARGPAMAMQPFSPPPQAAGVTSIYRHAPRSAGLDGPQGEPASPVLGPQTHLEPGQRCRQVSIGMRQLDAMVNQRDEAVVELPGPLELGAHGALAKAVDKDYYRRVRHEAELLRSAVELSDQGPYCGFYSMLFLRLAF